jgi:HAD superfamily hydrolase (TIGR01549 family)
MIENYIFDLDGTLLNSRRLTFEAIDYGLKKVNYPPLSREDLQLFYQSGIQSLIETYHIPRYKIWLAFYFFQKYKLDHLEKFQPFPGIVDVLHTLHQQEKLLGVVSSNSRRINTLILDNADINFFDFTRSAGFLRKSKSLETILNKYRLNPPETVYLGDEIHDIVAARQLGIKSAAITWGITSKESLAKNSPDYLITQPQDILKIN